MASILLLFILTSQILLEVIPNLLGLALGVASSQQIFAKTEHKQIGLRFIGKNPETHTKSPQGLEKAGQLQVLGTDCVAWSWVPPLLPLSERPWPFLFSGDAQDSGGR